MPLLHEQIFFGKFNMPIFLESVNFLILVLSRRHPRFIPDAHFNPPHFFIRIRIFSSASIRIRVLPQSKNIEIVQKLQTSTNSVQTANYFAHKEKNYNPLPCVLC